MSDLAVEFLCSQFDVACYQVGAVFESAPDGSAIPEMERDLWFVSVPVGSGMDELVNDIPLATSEKEAQVLAVRHLSLEARWMQ